MNEKIVNQNIQAGLLGSGWAAIHAVEVESSLGKYWDVQQTGIGRYKTKEEAVKEAKEWAQAEELEFKND